MIRLIVTDMDGCLLDPGGKLPPDFPEAFALMDEKQVLFAAASGRSADGLRIPFGSRADRMALITDNGARIFHNGNLLAEEVLETSDYLPLIKEFHSHSGLIPIACGRENIWIEDPDAITEKASLVTG